MIEYTTHEVMEIFHKYMVPLANTIKFIIIFHFDQEKNVVFFRFSESRLSKNGNGDVTFMNNFNYNIIQNRNRKCD